MTYQYIITEELLQPIEETAYPVSSEERQRLSEYARSHPYNPQAEREKVLSKFADLIHNESVRLSPAMVDMVYSYRVAQIIVELQEGKDGE